MSLNQALNEVKNDIQAGGIDTLTESLQKVSQISKAQFSQNKFGLKQEMQQLVDTIKMGVEENRQNITPQLKIAQNLKTILNNIPPQTKSAVAPQIQRLIRKTGGIIEQNQRKMIETSFQNAVDQQIISNETGGEKQGPLMNFNIIGPNDRGSTPIQRSLIPFQPLLQLTIPTIVKPNQMPQSMQFLTRYAQLQNTTGVGQVSNSTGQSFVGVHRKLVGNQMMTLPFQKNRIQKSQFPDIPNQIQYHANRTINSWNNFVYDEAKMLKFMNTISSAATRTQYVEDQFKKMTLYTFAAQTLATLTYFYVFMPLQRYAKLPDAKGTKDDFYQNYVVVQSPMQNPLIYKNQDGKTLCKLLLNDKLLADKKPYLSPSKLLEEVIKVLVDNTINLKALQTIKQHHQNKKKLATQFFKTSGVTKQVVQKLFAITNFDSIKKKKFVVQNTLQNHQYISIMNKISNQSQKNLKLDQLWNTTWGSQFLWAHNYIFKD